jgi:septation ring formation regulator EzrA
MKYLIITLILILLGGCGGGFVSKHQYENTVSELDDAKVEISHLQSELGRLKAKIGMNETLPEASNSFKKQNIVRTKVDNNVGALSILYLDVVVQDGTSNFSDKGSTSAERCIEEVEVQMDGETLTEEIIQSAIEEVETSLRNSNVPSDVVNEVIDELRKELEANHFEESYTSKVGKVHQTIKMEVIIGNKDVASCT